ncbi:hypothetical protein NESM_000376500 [Novymonas esmeraldas]|uniref:Uncharacterized protein n=1 Tax=Novymonas esmeraldas TaxID=1808958 RepID=A0AAW0EP29_9TRYP
MRSNTRANAFSDASAQAAALEEWKRKSAVRKEVASSLRDKVQRLKSDAEAGRRTAQWMQERDALNREQEACEAALDTIERRLGDAVAEPEAVRSRRLGLAALKTVLAQQLSDVGALHRTATTPSPSDSSRDAATAERVSEMREWIAAELKKCEAEEVALTAASLDLTDAPFTAAAECRAAARQAQQTLEGLCEAYQPAPQLRSAFEGAVADAEKEALRRIEDAGGPATSTTPPEVLRCVGLIVRMGQHARQYDISASTMSALAERVSAVYPAMPAAQVRGAIEDALRLRKARTASQAAVLDFRRATAALLSSCESAFLLEQQAAAQRAERAEATRLRVEAQHARHAHLAEERAAHAAVLRRRQTAEEQAQAAAAAREQALQAKRAEEFQERLHLFEAYTAQQAALREKEREVAALQAQAAAEAKAARTQHNGVRVEYRRQQDEQRQRAQKQREQELASLRDKKHEALQRFFASINQQIGVTADPQRVLKATSSSAQTELYTTLAQTTRPSLTGFSDEQIMKDPRVRLYHALLAAGLHTTPYGREVATRGYRVPPAQRSSEANPLRSDFA